MDEDRSLYVHKDGIADIEKSQEEASEEAPRGLELAGKYELEEAFVILRARGYSLRQCEEQLRVSKSALCNWEQELEGEIARAKAIELEALYEQFYMSKRGRIKLLGEQLQAVREELDSRDLSDVPTDRLFVILLRLYEELAEEYVEPRPLTDEEISLLKSLQ